MNTFNSSNVYLGSDLISVTKPPSGTSCPLGSSLTLDSATDLKDATNNRIFAPVPANQTDSSGTGYVVAIPNTLPAASLKLYQVTENPDGTMNLVHLQYRFRVVSYSSDHEISNLRTFAFGKGA